MTAPQPSPDHDTQAHEDPRPAEEPARRAPWAAASPAPGAPPRERSRWRREIAEALLVACCVAVPGSLALGLLWLWLAPRIPLVADGEAVLLDNSEGEHAVGADGTFLLLSLALGALAGAALFLLRRDSGVGAVIGLAAGALLASFLAFRLGVWLGPTGDVAAHAREVGAGVVFDAPLDLGARGVLLGLPFAALAVHLVCVAAWGSRDPQPTPPAEYPRWGGQGRPARGDGEPED